jgi:phosphatidylglycerophosphate synthase
VRILEGVVRSAGVEGRRTSRQQLEATFSAEKAAQDGLFSTRVYRRISFAVTPWFEAAGFSANSVTGLGLLCSLLLPLAALLLGPWDYVGVALLCFAYLVLDCVDGNLARLSGSSGPRGQYLDSLAGKVYALMRTLALGLIAAREWPQLAPGAVLSFAIFAALLFIWGRESRQYYKITARVAPNHFVAGSGRVKDLALAFTELVPPGLLVLGPFGLAWLVFLGLVFFYAALFVYTQLRIFRALRG